jgi:hypothetical protein
VGEVVLGFADEDESSVAEVAAVARFFGTGWEKKTKDKTLANARSAIRTMATAIGRLFIVA